MKKRLLALFCALAVGGAVTAKTVGATSPGGNLRMEIEVADKISYTVWSGADKVLDACTLSLTLADRTLGEAPRLRSVKRSSADEMLERRNPTKDAVVGTAIMPCNSGSPATTRWSSAFSTTVWPTASSPRCPARSRCSAKSAGWDCPPEARRGSPR